MGLRPNSLQVTVALAFITKTRFYFGNYNTTVKTIILTQEYPIGW